MRNLGGLNDARLFEKCPTGTKHLIEDYTNEVVRDADVLAELQVEGVLTKDTRAEFFNDTRQSFGNTALMLQGGATFGACDCGSTFNV